MKHCARTDFINTPLQRGGGERLDTRNRFNFNGFPRRPETVETVPEITRLSATPLKRGVNEKSQSLVAETMKYPTLP